MRKCGIIFDPCLYLTLAFVYFRISATGIATAWYASIYPFLANSKLLDRATEAMELSDAGELLGDFALPAACCLTTIHVN